jgi:uncharacterized protein (TIGR04255 family)
MLHKSPEFERPPLDEVVLSVQFDPLPGFHAAHLGRYWKSIREQYPHTEDQPPLLPLMEQPIAPAISPVSVHVGSMGIRAWFLDESKSRIIQLQQGRFVKNWRKLNEADQYPRYKVLVEEFKREWEGFLAFAREESLGMVNVNQCELTYIDHIEPKTADKLGDLDDIFTFQRPRESAAFLPNPEFLSWSAGYKLPGEQGRLHVVMNPAFRPRDMQIILLMNFTARGVPADKRAESVFGWFDLAHDWINGAFGELTDTKMHHAWGKKS